MIVYSKYSIKSEKEFKIFPMLAPTVSETKIQIVGNVNKSPRDSVKFCPLCDYPMIVRMRILPCSHVLCYSCSQPESDTCYKCENKIEESVRLPDNAPVYECETMGCGKSFLTTNKLSEHQSTEHRISHSGQGNNGYNRQHSSGVQSPYPYYQNSPLSQMYKHSNNNSSNNLMNYK